MLAEWAPVQPEPIDVIWTFLVLDMEDCATTTFVLSASSYKQRHAIAPWTARYVVIGGHIKGISLLKTSSTREEGGVNEETQRCVYSANKGEKPVKSKSVPDES